MSDWNYLSEMAVTNVHGGGITLQRILGPEVERFNFIKVGHFQEAASPIEGVGDRSVYMPPVTEMDRVRRLTRPVGRLVGKKVRRLVDDKIRRSHWQFLYSSRYLATRKGMKIEGPCLVCPQSALALHATHAFSRKRGFRYMTWMMDDHLLRNDGGRWLYSKQDHRLMRRHLKRATVVAAISPNLASFYKSEFGVEATVLFGPCDPIAQPLWEPVTSAGPIRLAYFGNVWPWQQDALAALLPLVDARDVELSIYTPFTTLPEELRHPAVRRCRPLEHFAEVISEMRRYDGVLIPASFQPELAHLSFFNIATKMSECIASGTITLVIGPSESAMASYLRAHDAAVLATSPDPAVLRRAVALTRDHTARRRLLENARRLSVEHLSTAAMRSVWRNAWARVLEEG